jgi:biopolymer transport protein ExbD
VAKIRRPAVSTEIPWVAMANIAFLLLIFYISTTLFTSEEGLTLVLPHEGGGVEPMMRKDVLVLRTDAHNTVYADDAPLPDLDRLSDLVKEKLRDNNKLEVSIETHPQARYRMMIKVLDEVKEAEALRISIKTAASPLSLP